MENQKINQISSKKSSGKNAEKSLRAKRKLSVNNSEEVIKLTKRKKQKISAAESTTEKVEQSVSKKSMGKSKVKLSDTKATCDSVKNIVKEGKQQHSKVKKSPEPAMEISSHISLKHESSDDQLPLSEIAKRGKAKKNANEKPDIKKKNKRTFTPAGNIVEGRVEISALKKVGDMARPDHKTGKLTLKGSHAIVDGVENERKSIEGSMTKKSKMIDLDKKSGKEHTSGNSIKSKTKIYSPIKQKKAVKDCKDSEEEESVKSGKHLSAKTEPGEDHTNDVNEHKQMNEKKIKTNFSVKETSLEEQVAKRTHQGLTDSEGDGDESEMEWEDVEEVSGALDNMGAGSETNDTPSTNDNVEFTISVPGKKSKCGRPSREEIRKWIQRKINRVKKENQICAHKVHLLTLLAVGLKKNEMCNQPLVQAVGLSILPEVFTQRKLLKTWDTAFLTRVTTWMKNKAPNPGEIHTGNSEATYLMRVLEKKVYLLIAILRALGLCVRLVMSLQVLSSKVTDANDSKKSKGKQSKTAAKTKKTTTPAKTPNPKSRKDPKNTAQNTLLNKLKSKSTPAKTGTPSSSRTLRKKASVDYTAETKSEYFNEDKTSNDERLSDDEDFEVQLKTPKRRRKSCDESPVIVESLQIAPAGGETSGVIKKGRDIWIEVYLEKEKKWICIDGDICSVNQPDECENCATKPIKYVMAFDNECSIKDVTCRYASGWMTTTPKLRVDPEWLTETLNVYRTKNLKRDKKEDAFLKARLLRKPLPQTVSEYKNHPLYVLQRHLLKFEAIYPESAATLGFCRGEGVYSRDCVHTLHTRELWMKEARVVKAGEQPYKIVKGRKSRRKMLENIGEVKAELFGRWQTEDYIPPPVVDGKVPRNEYGNVELFKPSMLPAGACHIQVPGIHRLAKKLNIDAALAVVGFDFHGGFNHPIIDGVVVGEEFKEQLLLEWDKEQQEKIKREQAKREKRVLDNWTHLVRSLRIRERLKRKYSVEEDDVPKSKIVDDSPTETENVTDISLSWPLNKQEGKTARDDDGHCHVFLPANHVKDVVTGEWSKVCACGLKEPLEELMGSII